MKNQTKLSPIGEHLVLHLRSHNSIQSIGIFERYTIFMSTTLDIQKLNVFGAHLSISAIGDQLLWKLSHGGVQVVQKHVDDRCSLQIRIITMILILIIILILILMMMMMMIMKIPDGTWWGSCLLAPHVKAGLA